MTELNGSGPMAVPNVSEVYVQAESLNDPTDPHAARLADCPATAVPWVAEEELIQFCADRVYRDLWLDDRPRDQENMKSHLRVARAVIGALREKGWGPLLSPESAARVALPPRDGDQSVL